MRDDREEFVALLTQNEDHGRHCSLFSIERQFPTLDVSHLRAEESPPKAKGTRSGSKAGKVLELMRRREGAEMSWP